MIVQCPSCASRYRIRDANIPPSGGKIRCPSCSHSFIVYPESNGDEDSTSITSQGDLSQLVSQAKQGGPSATDEDYVQTQVADASLDQYRAAQARRQELGDPDMDGTVEIQNPMEVWKEAQQAMQNAKANAAAAAEDPTGDEYDHAPTEVVNPNDLDFPMMQESGPSTQEQPPRNQQASPSQDPDPTHDLDANIAARARNRGDSAAGIDPAGNGSGVNPYAQNTPPSGQSPNSGSSTGGQRGFDRGAHGSGLQSSQLFDEDPIDEAPTLRGDSSPAAPAAPGPGEQSSGAGASGGGANPDHPGPWKLKTNFGLTYEFPDTRSLNSWLASREDLDGYSVSADDGDEYFDLGAFPQLEVGGRPPMQSGNFSVPASHGSGLTQAPSDPGQQPAPPQSSPSIDRPRTQSRPGDQSSPPTNPRPPSTGQPAMKGPRVQNEFRPPSRESKYQGLLWTVFFVLLLVAVGVGLQTFGVYDVVGAFNEHVLGKTPVEQQVTPPPQETPEVAEQPVDEEAMREKEEREVAVLLEDAQRLIDGNKLPAALEKLETTLQVAPENPQVYDMMADVHERLGQGDEASKAKAKAAELRGEPMGGADAGTTDAGAAEEKESDPNPKGE